MLCFWLQRVVYKYTRHDGIAEPGKREAQNVLLCAMYLETSIKIEKRIWVPLYMIYKIRANISSGAFNTGCILDNFW